MTTEKEGTTEKILLHESSESINMFERFLSELKDSVDYVLSSYQALKIASPLTLEDIKAMRDSDLVTTVIKKKLTDVMPDTEIVGLSVDKSKSVEFLKLPNLSPLTSACTKMFGIVDLFESRIKVDVEFNRIPKDWFRFLSIEGDEAKINSSLMDETIENTFKVYASSESQISLYNSLKNIADQLNTGVLKNIEPLIENRSFGRVPYADTPLYQPDWEHFFKKMFSWNPEKANFELKIDFITRH